MEGIPFAGRAGKFLTWGLENAGISRSSVWLTNVACCRPPRNDLMGEEGREAIAACRAGFDEELAFLRAQGVKVLVPLGNHALRALGLEGQITRVRGSVYEARGFIVLPTFHPSFVMRSQHKKEGAEVTYKYVWIADLSKAKSLVDKAWVPPAEHFILSPSVEDVERVLTAAVSNKTLLGVDIETTGRGERCRVVVVGIATDGETALSVPLLKKGGDPYWVNGDEVRVRNALNAAFKACPLMFQNAMFDVPILKEAGFEIDFVRVQEDTMVLHHAVSPELPHNLGFIVSLYGETPFWKDIFAERRGSVLEMADETLRTYNLRDAVVLHQVLPGLLADLREVDAESVYREESIKLLEPVSEMTQTGFQVDTNKLASLKARWTKERDTLEAKLKSTMALPSAFNLDSDDDLRWFLFGIEPAKFSKLEKLKEYDDATKTGKKKLRSGTKVHKWLCDLQDIREKAIRPYTLTGWKGRTTLQGAVQVDKQGLLAYQIQLQNRLKEVHEYKAPKFKTEADAIHGLLGWLRVYREYSQISKLLSTYTDYPLGHDGRVHPSFLVHGTATGRLSSRDPNLQNLPKKHEEAREPFVARAGYMLLSADYSNLEVRVLAYEVGDKALIKAVEGGVNIHDENTKVLFKLTPRSPLWDIARRAAKIFMFGGISYGGSDMEIHQKIAMEVPELALTMADYKKARTAWMDAHAGYSAWAGRIRTEVHTTHQSRTFRGRVRTLHGSGSNIEKEALNTPIQGGAAHIINGAMIRIHERKRGMQSRLIAQVHDQLIYETPLSELDAMKAIVKEEMERPVEYRGQQVSFPVDISTGPAWGALKEVEDDGDTDTDSV